MPGDWGARALRARRYNRGLQALLIVFGALFTLAVSYSLGSRLLAETCPDTGLRVACGAALLSTAVFLCCALGVAWTGVFLALGGAALLLAKRPGKELLRLDRRWWLVLAPYLALY